MRHNDENTNMSSKNYKRKIDKNENDRWKTENGEKWLKKTRITRKNTKIEENEEDENW